MLPQDLTDLLIKPNILYISPSPPCLPEDHPIHTPQSLDLVFHTARGSYMFMDYCRPPTPAPEQLRRMGSGASVVLDPTPEAEVQVESSLSSSSLSSRRLPCSRYKGVVPQPNGRWGAQIYERHQRVWLGTYGDQASAARAYDVAAQRFRGRDAATNFAPLSDASDDGALALAFLAAHSKAEIIDMLRKHTYYDELQQGKKRGYATGGVRRRQPGCCGSAPREILFDKVVTPSDVGKLNRLVIPKQHAEKHFPLRRSGGVGADDKGVLLGFEDAEGRLWRFRYSYWNSSQSYVLTKGWIRFVKEKRLRAGDVICFWQSTGPEKQLYIDRKAAGLTTAPEISCIMQAANNVRLFGVNISELPPRASNGKRAAADMELLPPPLSSKKLNQCCVKDDDL